MTNETKDRIRAIRDRIRITKVVATRSVKGAKGDTFVGWSAMWDTVQEDGSRDLETLSDSGTPVAALSVKDAQIASCLLGLQVDIAAHLNAKADGNLRPDQADAMIAGIKKNYARLLSDLTEDTNVEQPK